MNTNLLPALPIAIAALLGQGLKRAGAAFWRCYDRRQQRLVLSQLDARALRDLGLTRDQARIEADRPFWR